MIRRRDTEDPPATEWQLWEEVTRNVRPLRPGGTKRTEKESAPLPAKPAPVRPRPLTRATNSPLPPLAVDSTEAMDASSARRLRRGRMRIEARLDLHGHTREEAVTAFAGFVQSAYVRGARCLLVVTGKGIRSEGVLRGLVTHWINREDLRPLILACVRAQPQHGGSGALYLLLRRKGGAG